MTLFGLTIVKVIWIKEAVFSKNNTFSHMMHKPTNEALEI